MSSISSRIKNLEDRAGNRDDEPVFIFIRRSFIRPGQSGPEEVKAVCYETQLHDGRNLASEPGESIEAFQQRILNTDTGRKPGHGYRILDVTETSFDHLSDQLLRSGVYQNPITEDMSPEEASRIYRQLIQGN